MKNYFLLCFILLACNVFAQSDFSYELEVLDTKRSPKSNLSIVFIEKNTFERIEKKTDASGKLSMHFDHGDEWAVSIGEMANYTLVETRGRGQGSELVTYDMIKYERKNRLLPDRRNFTFEQVPQTNASAAQPGENTSVVKVILQNQQKAKFPGVPVTLTCFATNKQYTTKTNTGGEAVFMVPNGNDYEIDVEEIASMRYVDLGNESMIKSITVLYEKRKFTEKVVNGYTEQTMQPNVVASSSHSRVQLSILRDGSPAGNEPVYLRTVKSNTMYKGKTDANGTVIFMLPVKHKFLVDFTFQHDAAVIDLSRVEGIANQSMTIAYNPDPRLEHIETFIPRVKDLVEYDIESFLDKQYPDPTEDVELFMKWGNKFNASSKEAVVEIGFKVNKRRPANELPKNLVFVVDISGSMADEDRLELVKRNLVEVIGKCNPTDRIALVVFSDQAILASPSQLLTNRKSLTDIISTLSPTGGTNIYNGLVLGFEELLKYKKPGNVSRLVLLTDGYCSIEPTVTINKSKEFINKGLQISTIGVGTDYNKALLSQLASAGGGEMEMAGNATALDRAFQKTFGSMISPVGQNARLELLYNDQIVYRQLFGYANATTAPGKVTVSFDQLFPGLEKMALAKFDIINSTQEIEKMPVTARLTYTDLATKKEKIVEKKLYPEWSPATGKLDMSLDREHKKILATAIANQSLKNMANAFESGDNLGAENAAASGVKQIRDLFPDAPPHELTGLIKQLEEYVSVFETKRKSHH